MPDSSGLNLGALKSQNLLKKKLSGCQAPPHDKEGSTPMSGTLLKSLNTIDLEEEESGNDTPGDEILPKVKSNRIKNNYYIKINERDLRGVVCKIAKFITQKKSQKEDVRFY